MMRAQQQAPADARVAAMYIKAALRAADSGGVSRQTLDPEGLKRTVCLPAP